MGFRDSAGVEDEFLASADRIEVYPRFAAAPKSPIAMVAEHRLTTACGIEPQRQPPFAAIHRAGRRQRETFSVPIKDAGAAPRGQSFDV